MYFVKKLEHGQKSNYSDPKAHALRWLPYFHFQSCTYPRKYTRVRVDFGCGKLAHRCAAHRTQCERPLKANSHRVARHDTDWTVLSCLVWRCELSRPTDRCVLCLLCVGVCRAAQCDRRTHSDAERICPAVNSHRHTRQDKTVAPASRPLL